LELYTNETYVNILEILDKLPEPPATELSFPEGLSVAAGGPYYSYTPPLQSSKALLPTPSYPPTPYPHGGKRRRVLVKKINKRKTKVNKKKTNKKSKKSIRKRMNSRKLL
jgi:hypothetical protein